MSELLRVTGLNKTYQKGGNSIHVLRGLDFQLSKGERVAVVGASGAGKSTLLHLLGGLDRPSEGQIDFDGSPLYDRSERGLAAFRNQTVGFIFQFHYLLPEFTALENVAMPLLMRGTKRSEAFEQANALLKAVNLQDRMEHRPFELSGGEQQRVAIARALATSPVLLLADEPTGNLDIETARTVAALLMDVVKNQGRSLVLVTHNLELASAADRILKLDEGRLHAHGVSA